MRRVLFAVLLAATPAVAQTPVDPLIPVQVSLITPIDKVPEGLGEIDFLVRLDRPRLTYPVFVQVKIRGLTAESGEDFVPLVGLAAFDAAQMQTTLTLHIIDDDVIEDAEELLLIEIESLTPGALVVAPARIITILDDDGCPPGESCEATCTFSGVAHYPDGSYPARGTATVDDVHGLLRLTDDSGRKFFAVDLEGVAIGGETGVIETRDDEGRFRVELEIEENLDPGGVAEWDQLSIREQLASGRGLPERLAARRLRGRLHAVWAADSGSGADRIEAEFDAGNGPYHCEGGLEAQEKAIEEMLKRFEDDQRPR